jgi:hypothetical protein
MRCASCGELLSRARLGVAGAGFAMCSVCIGLHSHRQPVTFDDGPTVYAVSYIGNENYVDRELPPDYAVYLDEVWSPPWPYVHIEWPDYAVPANTDVVREQCDELLRRVHTGQRVEIGCVGGHGRTGTMLALLATMSGTPAAEAVAWVRAHYCESAVETPEQEAYVDNWSG